MIAKILVACLLALSLSAPALSQDEQALDAVKEFRRFFRKYREISQQVEAIHTLEGVECAAGARELVKLLDHKEPEIRRAAMKVLSTYKRVDTFKDLIDALPEMRKNERRAKIIEVLGRAGIVEAVPVLREIALNDKRAGSRVRFEIARALGRIGQPGVEDVISIFLGDADPMVRMAAGDTVARLHLSKLGKLVVGLLGDPVWQVRSAAVHATAVVRPQEAVQPLIDLMRKAGRLKLEAADALFAITTLDFGANPDEWQRQWDRLKSIDWRIPTDAEVAKAKQTRKRNDAFYGKKAETTTFSGITTTSTRVLFIIDVSGSMDDRVVQTEKFDAGYRDFKKLTIVKTELKRTIEGLGSNTYFNIVSFASNLKPWKKFLVPANIVNRSSAVAWVRRLRPIGGTDAQELAAVGLTGSANLAAGKTNTFKALLYPFGVDPDKSKRGVKTGASMSPGKNKLDTVFFLSDGRPSTGKLVDTNEILKEITKINEDFKIVFHSIAIGDFQKSFLRELARLNGGVFVDLGR